MKGVYLRKLFLGGSGRINSAMSGSNVMILKTRLWESDFLSRKDLLLQCWSLCVFCVQSWEWRSWFRKGIYFSNKHVCSASDMPSTILSS